MTSTYVRCDGEGCNAVVDRYPPEFHRGPTGDGTFGKFGGSAARAYAASIGWAVGISDGNPHNDRAHKDFCPACAPKQRKYIIAKAIFDWLSGDEGAGDRPSPPYTFHPDQDQFLIGVDGHIDCKQLAEVVDAALSSQT